MVDRDARIAQLIREKAKLQNRLMKTEADLKLEEAKTQRAHRLIGPLKEHVRNPG